MPLTAGLNALVGSGGGEGGAGIGSAGGLGTFVSPARLLGTHGPGGQGIGGAVEVLTDTYVVLFGIALGTGPVSHGVFVF